MREFYRHLGNLGNHGNHIEHLPGCDDLGRASLPLNISSRRRSMNLIASNTHLKHYRNKSVIHIHIWPFYDVTRPYMVLYLSDAERAALSASGRLQPSSSILLVIVSLPRHSAERSEIITIIVASLKRD